MVKLKVFLALFSVTALLLLVFTGCNLDAPQDVMEQSVGEETVELTEAGIPAEVDLSDIDTTRGITGFGNIGFFNVPDMITNLSDYFNAQIAYSTKYGTTLAVGLNLDKLAATIRVLPQYTVKNTNYNKIYARDFRLLTDKVTDEYIYVRATIQYKHYEWIGWPFKKYHRIFNLTGTATFKMKLVCNSATNEISLTNYHVSEIKIDLGKRQYLFGIVEGALNGLMNLFNVNFNVPGKTTLQIPWLKPYHVGILHTYTEDNFFYFKFKLHIKTILYDLVQKIKKDKLDFTDMLNKGVYIPAPSFKLDGPVYVGRTTRMDITNPQAGYTHKIKLGSGLYAAYGGTNYVYFVPTSPGTRQITIVKIKNTTGQWTEKVLNMIIR